MKEQSGRILVVDDEPLVRESLQAYLEDEGFWVTGANSGEAALEYITASPPDIAIVDMRLPGMSGNEFILRGFALHPGLRFLIYTGAPSYVFPQELDRVGLCAKDVFHKPVLNLGVMVARIKSLLTPI